MKSSSLIVTLLGVLALSGCDRNSLAHRLLTQQPTAQVASGSYALSVVNVDQVGEGINDKITTHRPVPTIVLHADGAAELSDFPLLPDAGNFNYSLTGFASFKADWRILPVGNISDGGSATLEVFGIAIDPRNPKLKTQALSFIGASTPDGLVLTLYDGTKGQALEFSRQQPGTSAAVGEKNASE